jgi:hypothetical protein
MTDTTPSLPEEDPEHKPRRNKRKLLLDDNEGDFRVMLVHPGGPYVSINNLSIDLPKGSLLPLTNFPGFMSSNAALLHLKARASQHNAMLSGQVVAIIRFSQIVRLELLQAVQVTMAKKPKREVDTNGEAG